MKIDSLKTTSPNFNAEIVKTTSMEKFYKQLYARPNSPHIKLWDYVREAVANHPSNSRIYTRVNYFNKNNWWMSRAALSNLSDVYIDKEATNSMYLTVWNAWKNILDPKNKNEFHKLFGKRYAPIYDEWWNKNVMPIWNLLKNIN